MRDDNLISVGVGVAANAGYPSYIIAAGRAAPKEDQYCYDPWGIRCPCKEQGSTDCKD